MFGTSLPELRASIGVTQGEMAMAMGVPLRTYEDLEAGKSTVRPVHIRAAYMAAQYLITVRDEGDLPEDLIELIKKSAAKIAAGLRAPSRTPANVRKWITDHPGGRRADKKPA